MAVFQIRRRDGTLQLDGEIGTYVFHSKGTVVTGDSHLPTQATSTAYFPMVRDSNEILAVRGPNGYAFARYADFTKDGVWYHIYHTMFPKGTTMTWYRFIPAMEVPGLVGPGLELRNRQNQITYASNMRALRCWGTVSNIGTSFSLTAGRDYAAIIQTLAGKSSIHYDGDWYEEYDDKGRPTGQYWTGSQDNPLYGVRFDSQTTGQLTRVEFNNQSVRAPKSGNSPPPDQVSYDLDIINLMMVDVTYL